MKYKYKLNRKSFLLNTFYLLLFLSIFNCKKEDPYEEFKNLTPDVWAPQSLTIADISITEKTLVWIYQLTNIEGFRLDRKIDDDPWQVGYREFPKELRIWNDDNILPDISITYHYRLYAYAGDYYSGAEEASSPIVFPPPAVVTTEKITEKRYKISWMDMTIGEQGFKIDHRVAEGAWEIAYATVGADQTSYIDTNVFRSADIQYRVYGFYEDFNSEKITVNTNAALTPPTELQIIKNSVSSVTIHWQDNSDGEDDFWIERKHTGEDWEHIASVKENTYIDTDFKLVSSVNYRVSAHAGQYNSEYTQNSINAQLLAPLGLQIYRTSITTATLSWSDNNNGEEGFKIERKYEGGNWSLLNTTTDNSYVDNDFELDKQVYYRVYTYYGNYNSAWAEVIFNSEIPPPINLQLDQSSITSISLSWQFPVTGHDGFIIERKYGSGNWEILSIVTSNNFEDNGFELNSQVYYKVYAYFNSYNSMASETNFDSTIPSPENFQISINSNTSITLNWDYNYINHDGFKIDRKINNEFWEEEYITLNSSQNAYTDNNLDLTNNAYHYRIYVFYDDYISQKLEESVSLLCGYPFTDSRDGKVYETVQIGEQCWMKENLAYLPSVSPPHYGGDENYPYYYVYGYYGNSVSQAKATNNYQTYGVLYNQAASEISCPSGWHLSTASDWNILIEHLGGWSVAGGKLKETGTSHWKSPNTGASNSSGFTALPGGGRSDMDDDFISLQYFGEFWLDYYGYAKVKQLHYQSSSINSVDIDEEEGNSVRCVRD